MSVNAKTNGQPSVNMTKPIISIGKPPAGLEHLFPGQEQPNTGLTQPTINENKPSQNQLMAQQNPSQVRTNRSVDGRSMTSFNMAELFRDSPGFVSEGYEQSSPQANPQPCNKLLQQQGQGQGQGQFIQQRPQGAQGPLVELKRAHQPEYGRNLCKCVLREKIYDQGPRNVLTCACKPSE